MKKYNIIFTSTFTEMFNSVSIQYTHYSSTYSDNIEKKLYKAIHLLKTFPYSAPLIKYKGIPQIYRKSIIKNRFFIIFKIINDEIYLLYFIDGRQNPQNYLKLLKK